jgi:hypothetical protein
MFNRNRQEIMQTNEEIWLDKPPYEVHCNLQCRQTTACSDIILALNKQPNCFLSNLVLWGEVFIYLIPSTWTYSYRTISHCSLIKQCQMQCKIKVNKHDSRWTIITADSRWYWQNDWCTGRYDICRTLLEKTDTNFDSFSV